MEPRLLTTIRPRLTVPATSTGFSKGWITTGSYLRSNSYETISLSAAPLIEIQKGHRSLKRVLELEDSAPPDQKVEALDKAMTQGRASVIYDGEHIDIAHVKTARDILALAQSFTG